MILHFEAAFNLKRLKASPNRSFHGVLRLCSALLFGLLGVIGVAASQELLDTTRTYAVEEVTVIEARSGLDPARLPYSASVLTLAIGISSRPDAFAGALEAIPGVFASSRSGGTDLRLTIRGFGARGNGDRSNSGTIRGVKVLLDGIPLTEPDGRTSPDLLTFLPEGRMEVLRTNASALFGNASGGIVNVESAEPADELEWSLSSSAGSFGLRKAIGRVGLPFEGGSVVLSGGSMSLDGWRQNSSVQAANAYAVATVRPSRDLRIRATFGLTRHRFGIPGALTDAEYAADPSMSDPAYAARRERRENLTGLSSLQVSHTLGGTHTISATAYLGPKSLVRSERNTYREFQRWAGGGGLIWRWALTGIPGGPVIAAGIDGSVQDGGSLFYTLRNGERGDSLRTNKGERAENAGIFMDASASLWTDWTFSAGVRYDRQHYQSSVFPAGATLSARVEQLAFHHATPHAGVSYAVGGGHAVFASYSGGLETPAFNEVDPPPGVGAADLNPLLKPMLSTTVEAGYRSHGEWIDGWAFSTSAAAFFITIRNEMVPFSNGAWFLSAGRSERFGAEVAASVTGRSGIAASVAWTALRGAYREFQSSAGSFDGNIVPGIPSHTLNVRFGYTMTDGVSFEVSGRRIGSMEIDDANTLRIPASAVVDGAVAWMLSLRGLQLGMRCDVRNLFNAHYASGGFINPASRATLPSLGSGVAPAYREPGLPRNVIVTVSLRPE